MVHVVYRLLHPFMPFVTEELWQRLPRQRGQAEVPSIMLARFPVPCREWDNPSVVEDMSAVLAVVGAARGLRARTTPLLQDTCGH